MCFVEQRRADELIDRRDIEVFEPNQGVWWPVDRTRTYNERDGRVVQFNTSVNHGEGATFLADEIVNVRRRDYYAPSY